jgi:hypothetical protein
MRALVPFRTLVVAVLVFAVGCQVADAPTTPEARGTPRAVAARTILSSPVTVDPLLRLTPLSAPITVSKKIGVLGGTIAVPGTGLTVVVPALAVSSTTTFSVTALAGSGVAYDFSPHGTFNVPLVMTQDLSATQAQSGGSVNPLSLFAAYFPNANNITSVTELLNVGVNLSGQLATFTVTHFSGYIMASGRSSDE